MIKESKFTQEHRNKLSASRTKYSLRHDAFSDVFSNSETALWAGLLATDGNVHWRTRGGTPRININLQTQDRDILEKFADFLCYTGPIRDAQDSRYIGTNFGYKSTIDFPSLQMANDLAAIGILPNKSKSLRIHNNLVINQNFWTGAIYGDGNIRIAEKKRKNGTVAYYPRIELVGSILFCQQFQLFCQTYCNTKARVLRRKENLYGFVIESLEAIKIFERLFSNPPVRMERKCRIADEILTRFSIRNEGYL